MTVLFEKVADTANIRRSYEVLRNRYFDRNRQVYTFKPGPDGETLDSFDKNAELNLGRIVARVRSGEFSYGPCLEKSFQKGGKRLLIAQFNLSDRIIFRAVYQVVAPAYDHIFADSLASYRRGQGCWDSVLRAMRVVRREDGKLWVFRTDVRHYVDSLDHDILRTQLRDLLKDEPGVLKLFLAFLLQPRIVNTVQKPRDVGAHRGSELTTFFYNLYLNGLDHRMEEEGFRYSRYSDDIIVWGKSEDEAKLAQETVKGFVEKMKLRLNTGKTFIAAPGDPYEYLGYAFQGLSFTISEHSLDNLKRWVRHRLRRSLGRRLIEERLSEEEVLKRLVEYFQSPDRLVKLVSWLRYFHRINNPRQLRAVDKMIRERIAACLTQRFTPKNYKRVKWEKLKNLGLYSLVNLHYMTSKGQPLPADVQQKIGDHTLFSPNI